MSASREVHFSLRWQCPSWLNANDAALSNHASIYRALGDNLLTPGRKDGEYVCSSLQFVS
jgi:hypothetical protein